jgi:hypothetical protein
MDGRVVHDCEPRQSGFRAYRFTRIYGVGPCDECGDPGCTEGDTVDITDQVRALENQLAKYEGQTNAV